MNVVVYNASARGRGDLQAAGVREGRERDRQLADRGRAVRSSSRTTTATPGRPRPRTSATTSPGVERVDIDADGGGCRKVWRSDETAPTVVPKLSLGNGLVYAYTNPPNQGERRRRLVPDGASTSATGGRSSASSRARGSASTTTTRRSRSAPTGPRTSARSAAWSRCATRRPPPQGLGDKGGAMDDRINGSKPRLKLRVKRLRRARVRVTVLGADRAHVRRVEFKLGNRRLGVGHPGAVRRDDLPAAREPPARARDPRDRPAGRRLPGHPQAHAPSAPPLTRVTSAASCAERRSSPPSDRPRASRTCSCG